MTPTLSPRTLLREAYALRLDEDPALTQARLAEMAGMPRSRVSEAFAETVPCACVPRGFALEGCATCNGSGRVTAGEPHPATVARLLRALGFAMGLVDVRGQ